MALIVLVVEDEYFVRENIVSYLEAAGCVVHQAETGEQAIALCKSGLRIDVVFTDIRLNGLSSGWDVAEAFRATRVDMPMIYTSGGSSERPRPVSGSLFFNKPYEAVDVLNACHQLAESRAH
jgi:CheY-like chemotaxis protein